MMSFLNTKHEEVRTNIVSQCNSIADPIAINTCFIGTCINSAPGNALVATYFTSFILIYSFFLSLILLVCCFVQDGSDKCQ
jgi:energy-converting hydrogenase Eha subunit F